MNDQQHRDDVEFAEFKVQSHGRRSEYVLLPCNPDQAVDGLYFGDDVPATRRNLAWVSCCDDTEGSPFFYASLDEIDDDLVLLAHNLSESPEFTIERRDGRTDRQLVEHFAAALGGEEASMALAFAMSHGNSFEGYASDLHPGFSDTCEVEATVSC